MRGIQGGGGVANESDLVSQMSPLPTFTQVGMRYSASGPQRACVVLPDTHTFDIFEYQCPVVTELGARHSPWADEGVGKYACLVKADGEKHRCCSRPCFEKLCIADFCLTVFQVQRHSEFKSRLGWKTELRFRGALLLRATVFGMPGSWWCDAVTWHLYSVLRCFTDRTYLANVLQKL